MGRTRYRYWVLGLVALVTILVALRLALPHWVKDYLNNQLADMGAYQGYITDVDIALWRGAYALSDVEVTKSDGSSEVPFFEADSIDLSISWRALLDGAVVAEVGFIRPELHFVDGGEQEGQAGTGTDWREAIQQLVPIRIDRLEIEDGVLHFHNFQSDPEVHLLLTEINGKISNITNVDRDDDAGYADANLEGMIFEDAHVFLEGSLDPLGDFRNFSIRLKTIDIDLTRINDLAEAYGNFDFESGTGSFIMELEADDGELVGYAKPILDNVVILDVESDSEDGLLNVAWEAVLGALGRIFRNQPEERIASQIEIRGDLDQQEMSAWQALASVLRNAFVEAYEASFGRE